MYIYQFTDIYRNKDQPNFNTNFQEFTHFPQIVGSVNLFYLSETNFAIFYKRTKQNENILKMPHSFTSFTTHV